MGSPPWRGLWISAEEGYEGIVKENADKQYTALFEEQKLFSALERGFGKKLTMWPNPKPVRYMEEQLSKSFQGAIYGAGYRFKLK